MRITGESSGERFEFGYLRRLGGLKSSRDLVKKGLEIPEHDSMIAKEMRILTQGGQVVTFARLHVISRAPQFCDSVSHIHAGACLTRLIYINRTNLRETRPPSKLSLATADHRRVPASTVNRQVRRGPR